MFKRLFMFLTLLFALSMIWGQGVVDFENVVLPTGYSDGSFDGAAGSSWTYGHSRDQDTYPIDGNGLMIRYASTSYLEGTILGGVGSFSFQYRKAYTGTSVRQLELYINGVLKETGPEFGTTSGIDPTIHTMTVNDINVAGNVVVKIKNTGDTATNKQTVIDNIVWTGYTGAAIPTIAASGTLSAFNTSVGTPSAAQSYTLQGLNLTQNISVNAPAGFEISPNSETFTSSLSLAADFNGNVYVRLTGTTLGNFSGDITHTSSGATQVDKAVSGTVSEVLPEGYFVDFEGPGETKTAYASGTVNLSGLDWDMTEAVIGDLEDEVIEGTRSARFSGKNTSSMTMLEDKTGGLGSLSFKYRAFRGDAQEDWKVEYSTNAGASWIQIGDSFTATSTVQTFSETVDAPGNVRVKISVVGTPGTSNKRMNLDDILMTNYGAVVPFINVSGTLNAFATEVGTPSTAQTYNLSGDNLTANIQIAAPAGFEISSNGNTYSNSLSLSPNFDGNIYVRLAGTTLGDYSGNITHNSTDAQEVTLPVSGEVFEPAEPGDPIVLFVEDFDYPVDTILEDTGGWLAHSGTNNPVMVVDGNLSYAGYIQNAGNMVELIATGQDVNHTFAPQTEGSVYAAVLINVDSAQATGDYFMHFGPETMTSIFAGRVFLKKDGDSDNAFIGLVYSSGAGAVTQYTTTSYPFGSTILLVLKYDIIPGEKNDVASLFINPTPNAPEPMTADLISASGYASAPADLVSVGSFGLRQGNANNAAVLGVDGIRITNDWNLLWTSDMPDQPMIYVEGEQEEPMLCVVGTPSEEYFEYTLYGEHLSGPITITAPEHFQVTTDPEGAWADQIQVSASFNGTIYVRIYANVLGEHSGNIVHSSTGADNVSLRIEGEALAPLVGWGLINNMGTFEADYGEDSNVQSYSLNVTNAQTAIDIEVTRGPFVFSKTSATGPWTAEDTLPANFSGNIWVKMISTRDVEVTGEITHETLNASPLVIDLEGVIYPPTGDFAQDLFISEYVEGSSNNKALEIFNGTGMSVDLSNYRLLLFANGASTPNNTHNLSGTLAHGDVIVYVHGSAGAALAALGDETSNATNFNGDDAISLQKQVGDNEWIDIDIFGVIGEDPGTEWTADGGYSTLDKTLVRKAFVTQGVSVNPSGHEEGSPSGFATLATEWDVYPRDTFEHLGFHIFAPGGDPVAETPQISPAGGLKTEPIYVTMSTTTDGATIYYTTDGNEPTEASTEYLGQFLVNETTTVKAKAFAAGYIPSATATVSYQFPVVVNSIAELRAKPTGDTYAFKLATEAIITYQNDNRHTKYIQDSTAAIVIDDYNGIITTTYQLYDGITGVTGYLNKYNELLQFVPLANAPAATSSGNVVIPVERTLENITSDDQAKLIKVMNVTLDATGNFTATAQNINIVGSSVVMRTFVNTDYADTPIPQTPVNIIALGGQFNQAMQFSPRFLSDFEAAAPQLVAPELEITEANGQITVSWATVPGATNYKVYGSDDPYTGFTLLQSSSALSYSETAGSKRFYYVIAE